MKKAYLVAVENDPSNLGESVSTYLSEGWELQGGLCMQYAPDYVNPNTGHNEGGYWMFSQALVKEDK